MRNLGEGCDLESYRETVVDIFGARFCHTGVSQVYLVEYDRLERDKNRGSQASQGMHYSKHSWCYSPYPPLQAQVP